MRRSLVVLGLSFALPACMTQPAAERAEAGPATGPRCIAVQDIVARRVVNDHMIAFDVPGATYQAEVAEACAALARGPSLVSIDLDFHGGEVCSGDFFRIVDPAEVAAAAAPRCRIGRFSRVAAPVD